MHYKDVDSATPIDSGAYRSGIAALAAAGRRFLLNRALDFFPHARAGVVNRKEQFCLLGDIFEVAHQGGAVFTALQVLFRSEIGVGFEEFRQSFLKISTIHVRPVSSVLGHTAGSFRSPVRSRSRSFMRALCSCDLLFPMEQASMSAISLCS